jgi:hypothetical protein
MDMQIIRKIDVPFSFIMRNVYQLYECNICEKDLKMGDVIVVYDDGVSDCSFYHERCVKIV